MEDSSYSTPGYSTPGYSTPGWRERITGRWALSWQAYAIGVAVNVPLLVLTGGHIGTHPVAPGQMPALLLLGLGAAAIVGAWVLAMDATAFRNRRTRPVPLWLFGILHGVSGLVFGVAVVLGDRLLGVPPVAPPVLQVLLTVLIGLWWGVSMALLLEARERFREERGDLLEDAVAAEAAALRESQAAVRMRDLVDREVDAELSAARQQMSRTVAAMVEDGSALLPPKEWLRVAATLRETAQATVRPLSRTMWEATEERYPEPRFSGVLAQLVRRPRYLPMPAAYIVAIGFTAAGIDAFGPYLGPIASLLLAGIVGLVLAGSNALAERVPSARYLAYLIALGVSVGLGVVLALMTADDPGDAPATILVSGAVVGMLVSLLLTSFIASLNTTRSELLTSLRGDVERQRIAQAARSRELATITREAAKELHGTVQTRLIACAAAIEQASRAEDSASFAAAIRESLAILDRPITAADDDSGDSVAAQVDLIVGRWRPFMDIDCRLEPAIAMLQDRDDIARVVEEALANAYRHGDASCVSIEVATEPQMGSCRVVVEDDGCGPTGGPPGMGSTLLAQLSEGRTELSSTTRGARLVVELPA